MTQKPIDDKSVEKNREDLKRKRLSSSLKQNIMKRKEQKREKDALKSDNEEGRNIVNVIQD
jgi:hypothetical protein